MGITDGGYVIDASLAHVCHVIVKMAVRPLLSAFKVMILATRGALN